jgi:hypothetical protein
LSAYRRCRRIGVVGVVGVLAYRRIGVSAYRRIGVSGVSAYRRIGVSAYPAYPAYPALPSYGRVAIDLSAVDVRFRPEGPWDLSPGFYEAELVKSSLRKSVFKSFWFILAWMRQQLDCDRLWCLIGTVRGTSTVMIKDQSQLLF